MKAFSAIEKAFPLSEENLIDYHIFLALKSFGFEFLDAYGQLPHLTQDEANALMQKFMIFDIYYNLLSNHPYQQSKAPSTPEDIIKRLG